MIDTSAVYPVWISGEERLQRLGAVKKNDSVPFGGLGGMTNGMLYEIPALRIGDLILPVPDDLSNHAPHGSRDRQSPVILCHHHHSFCVGMFTLCSHSSRNLPNLARHNDRLTSP